MRPYLIIMILCIAMLFTNNTIGEENMEKPVLDPNIHHYLGIELNMQVWNLLGKADRDANDNNRMVAFAKGSLYHWHHSPHFQPVNAQRGEWLISRVYAVLNSAGKALHHALNCHELTKKLNLEDFDLAYSCEALARAYALSGDRENFEKYYKLAEKAGEKIEDAENKKLFFEDLKSEPWALKMQ